MSAVLCVVQAASAAAGATPFTRTAPPPPRAPVSSTLRDALMTIEHAAITNPAAAQAAAFSYNAAIEQYRAHAYEQARQSALTAIRQATAQNAPAAPVATTWVGSSVFPGPRYYIVGDTLPPTRPNAQRYVALAHRALGNCASLAGATLDYRDALTALSARRYRAAMAEARNIVDDCTSH